MSQARNARRTAAKTPDANRVRGEAVITLDGKEYRTRLTMRALAEIEDGLAIDNINEIERVLSDKPSTKAIAVVLGAMVRAGGAKITNDEIRELNVDISELGAAIGTALAGAVAVADAARDEEAADAGE